jgi:hypothetical protein
MTRELQLRAACKKFYEAGVDGLSSEELHALRDHCLTLASALEPPKKDDADDVLIFIDKLMAPRTGEAMIRLALLIPELEHDRETHRQWRDCDESYRQRNPSIGDSKFHADCVAMYDERIRTARLALETIVLLNNHS